MKKTEFSRYLCPSDGLLPAGSCLKSLTHKEVGESAIIMAINRRPAMRSIRISKGIRAFAILMGLKR